MTKAEKQKLIEAYVKADVLPQLESNKTFV